ncbi:MAG: hypothetical protein LJE64_13410 [Desulfofustis sp.]|jgi:hypothetical protein|nr:hypothetical protein [Desulfofustis sp.]
MSREYSFNLAVPLEDFAVVEELLAQAKRNCPPLRISRKTDRHGCARFYLSFPFTPGRPDLKFQEWFAGHQQDSWDLFGPTPGRWGLVT